MLYSTCKQINKKTCYKIVLKERLFWLNRMTKLYNNFAKVVPRGCKCLLCEPFS